MDAGVSLRHRGHSLMAPGTLLYPLQTCRSWPGDELDVPGSPPLLLVPNEKPASVRYPGGLLCGHLTAKAAKMRLLASAMIA